MTPEETGVRPHFDLSRLRTRRVFALVLTVMLAVAAAPRPVAAADAPKGWFGLVLSIDGDGSWFRPALRSVTVESVAHASPAEAAGVAAGDQVEAVDGITVAGAKADAVRSALRKSPGDRLRLKVRHGGGPAREVTLVAAPWPAKGP